MNDENLIYRIALSLLNGIGPVNARNLLSYCGGLKEIFQWPAEKFLRIPGIGKGIAGNLNRNQALSRAEDEVKFIKKNNIKALFYLDPDYPQRLKHCNDSPVIIYSKTSITLNQNRTLSIVGTRKATEYGKMIVQQIVEELTDYNVIIISGLAYGIDYHAHHEALRNNIPTLAVLGHSLDRIYPAVHSNLAKKMLLNGGLVSEYPSGTKPDRENFPQRNRIIAGLSDVVIVVESNLRGGAVITAIIANSYNRDVYAVPGNINHDYSKGCNQLIVQNRAVLFSSVKQLADDMGWNESNTSNGTKQTVLPVDLTKEEQIILSVLSKSESKAIDRIVLDTAMSTSKVSANLLELEFKGLVITMPGKHFKIS